MEELQRAHEEAARLRMDHEQQGQCVLGLEEQLRDARGEAMRVATVAAAAEADAREAMRQLRRSEHELADVQVAHAAMLSAKDEHISRLGQPSFAVVSLFSKNMACHARMLGARQAVREGLFVRWEVARPSCPACPLRLSDQLRELDGRVQELQSARSKAEDAAAASSEGQRDLQIRVEELAQQLQASNAKVMAFLLRLGFMASVRTPHQTHPSSLTRRSRCSKAS